MTALDDLIDGASGDDVPVATLLRKVKVLASRLRSVAFEEWVDHELTGYPLEADQESRADRTVRGNESDDARIARSIRATGWGPLFSPQACSPTSAIRGESVT